MRILTPSWGQRLLASPKTSGHTISFPEVKRPQREADHSIPSIAEDIKDWSATSTATIRHRDVNKDILTATTNDETSIVVLLSYSCENVRQL
jgi:hypothetical protein